MLTPKITYFLPVLWFTVAPLLVSTTAVYYLQGYLETHAVDAVMLIGLYTTATFCMGLALVPTTLMAIVTGYIGGWTLLPVMVISYVLASLIGYGIGQFTQTAFWLDLIHSSKKGRAFLGNVGDQTNLFVFSCRLSPVLPFGLTNVALSILGIPLRRFLMFGTLGMLPRTVLSMWLGMTADNFSKALDSGKELPVFQLVTAVLVLASSGLMIKVFFVGKKSTEIK